MTTPDVLTPAMIEAKLRRLVGDLDQAQEALRVARDAEVAAVHEYKRVRREALLSGECPRVTRGGWTVAEQTAWVDQQAADQEFAADLAEATRAAAQERLRVLLAQGELVRSLGASVRGSMALAGATG